MKGKKTGGRQKGTPNKKTQLFNDVLEKHNFCPATAMIDIYNEAKKIYKSYGEIYDAITTAREKSGNPMPLEDKADKYLKIAGDMAKELGSYTYVKHKAVDATIDMTLMEKFKEFESKSDDELMSIIKATVTTKA